MSPSGSLDPTSTDRWKYALLGGLASVPLTVAGYWQTGSELSLSPVFFGGVLAGYLATRNTGATGSVGPWTGLVGGVPALLVLVEVLGATSGLGGPSWFVATGVVLAVGTAAGIGVLALGLAALAGELGARVGGWLAGRTSGRNPPPAGS